MREQLIQYVNLLFAGAPDSDEIRAEILQNTLDRYDDLITQGKSPEAAYRLSISGIGDINEILGTQTVQATDTVYPHTTATKQDDAAEKQRRQKRAVAIAMYILCPVPVIILGDVGSGVIGVCMMFLLIAAATALLIMNSEKDEEKSAKAGAAAPQNELKKSISTLVWAVGLGVYFVVSFRTGAWYITWLIFPIIGCVQGIVSAIIDLKEAGKQ